MGGRSNSRKGATPSAASRGGGDSTTTTTPQSQQNCFEGERLSSLLQSIKREMELIMRLDNEKLWLKQQFSIGVNEVTRLLEWMPPLLNTDDKNDNDDNDDNEDNDNNPKKAPSVKLQAILLANDCNPRSLTKHLPGLASSRGVPLIFVRDVKKGSLRLGELVKLKTAIAIGIKARGNSINKLVANVLLE